jgi:hypothetical protein
VETSGLAWGHARNGTYRVCVNILSLKSWGFVTCVVIVWQYLWRYRDSVVYVGLSSYIRWIPFPYSTTKNCESTCSVQ